MNRKIFLGNLLGFGGLAAVPSQWVKNYTKIYLMQCFVAGFQYYEGLNLLTEMNEGSMLELVREPDNEYDSCAIALHFNQQKIGFIPANINDLLSRLIDSGTVELMAEITHLQKEARTWENVAVAVYLLKEDKTPLPTHAGYLTQLETPHYTTLKRTDGKISKVYYEGDGEWYDTLIDQMNGNYGWVYQLIQPILGISAGMKMATKDFVTVNKNDLAAKPDTRPLLDVLDDALSGIDAVFDDDGLVVLQTEKLTDFLRTGRELHIVQDKLGRNFLQLKFEFS